MPTHILSVSYDEHLLVTRRLMLEREGHQVTSALGFAQATTRCKEGAFDLLIMGHTIPATDKQKLIEIFRSSCPAPVLSLRRQGDTLVAADFHVFSDSPDKLLKTVGNILTEGHA